MKGIAKDCLSLQCERSIKKLHYISGHTLQFLSIGWESPVFMIH